jgi:hypothetical protein
MGGIINFLKENPGMTFLSVILCSLAVIHKDLSMLVILLYIYIAKLFWSDFFSAKIKKTLTKCVWVTAAVLILLSLYEDAHFPHGPEYGTGDVECANDGRGPCAESYKEDMRELNIPEWVKFLRENKLGLFLGLTGLGIALSRKESQD